MNQSTHYNDSDIISAISSKQRLYKLTGFFGSIFILIMPFVLVAGILTLVDGRTYAPFILIPGILLIPITVLINKANKKLKTTLKSLLGKYIIKDVLAEKIDIDEYSPSKFINTNFIKNCMILPNYDRVNGSDYISGKYKGINFTYCDLLLEREVEKKDNDGHTHTKYVTVFQGPLMLLKLGRSIDCYVRIKERKNTRKSKGVLTSIFNGAADLLGIKHDTDIIETENEAFNNQFEVKTNNDEMAFYILTPQFMESIMRADEIAEGYTNIEFKNSDVTITLNNGKDAFEVKKTISSKRSLEKCRENFRAELSSILSIVDEILTKENLF